MGKPKISILKILAGLIFLCVVTFQAVFAQVTKQEWEELKGYDIYFQNILGEVEEANVTIGDLNEYAKALLNGSDAEISMAGDSLVFNINGTKILFKKQEIGRISLPALMVYVPVSITANGTIGNELQASESVKAIVKEAETYMVEKGMELPAQRKERAEKETEEQNKKFGDAQLLEKIQAGELWTMREWENPLTLQKNWELKRLMTIGELLQHARLIYPNAQPKAYSKKGDNGRQIIMLSLGGDFLPIIVNDYENKYEIQDIGASQFVNQLAQNKGK